MIVKRDCIFTPKLSNRPLHIWLPDDYYESDRRYPVMYFFDGHNLFRDEDATYGKSWGLADFLAGWPKDMIIVGMECGHEGRERLDEYSPYSFHNHFMGVVTGMGDDTMLWITREVKPMIDREYRTYSHREATGIAGSSMGGLMALYAAVRYNEVFSKAGCLSSAIGCCKDQLLRDVALAQVEPDTRVYLSWGTEEAGGTRENPDDDWTTATAASNLECARLLENKGAMVKLFCQRFGHHCEADWEKQLGEFMDWLWF